MSSLNVHSWFLLAVCAQLVALGLAELLYPYGLDHDDTIVPPGDDNSYAVSNLQRAFKFDGINHQNMEVRI